MRIYQITDHSLFTIIGHFGNICFFVSGFHCSDRRGGAMRENRLMISVSKNRRNGKEIDIGCGLPINRSCNQIFTYFFGVSCRNGEMSLTLQLLRMDAEDVWTRHRQRRQHNANAASNAAEAKPEAAVNCAKVVAEAPHSYCKSTLNFFHFFSLSRHVPSFKYVLYQFPVNCYIEFHYIILRC